MKPTYETHVFPFIDRFVSVKISEKDIERSEQFANEVVSEKMKEQQHQKDSAKETKRWKTGTLGEFALEKLLDSPGQIVNWTVGKSAKYNVPDLQKLGLNIGIKSINSTDKNSTDCLFPLTLKNPVRPEIIVIVRADGKGFFVCGLATVEVLKKYQDDKLKCIANNDLKTGFYGFEHLIPFKNLTELKEIYKKL